MNNYEEKKLIYSILLHTDFKLYYEYVENYEKELEEFNKIKNLQKKWLDTKKTYKKINSLKKEKERLSQKINLLNFVSILNIKPTEKINKIEREIKLIDDKLDYFNITIDNSLKIFEKYKLLKGDNIKNILNKQFKQSLEKLKQHQDKITKIKEQVIKLIIKKYKLYIFYDSKTKNNPNHELANHMINEINNQDNIDEQSYNLWARNIIEIIKTIKNQILEEKDNINLDFKLNKNLLQLINNCNKPRKLELLINIIKNLLKERQSLAQNSTKKITQTENKGSNLFNFLHCASSHEIKTENKPKNTEIWEDIDLRGNNEEKNTSVQTDNEKLSVPISYIEFTKKNKQPTNFLDDKDTTEVKTTSAEIHHKTTECTDDSKLNLDSIIAELLNEEEEKEIEKDGMNEYYESYLSKKKM